MIKVFKSISNQRMEKVHSDIRGPLFQQAVKMKAEGTNVLMLNTGNPATFGFGMPKSVKDALVANLDRGVGYCDLKGMPDAREAICNYETSKGIMGLTPDDIFIGNGISECAEMLLLGMLEAGDEILMPSPGYSLWTNSAHLAGATPVLYRCDEKADWNPDIADIKSKINNNTKAIVIINPNNPTGALYSKDFLEEIIKVAREHGLVIISDEIYDRLLYDGAIHVSTGSLCDDLCVVTLNGLSKSHFVCGFRIGWMAISGKSPQSDVIRNALTKLSSMRLCSNALSQPVIPAALNDPESTMAQMQPGGRLYEQRKATMEELAKIDGISFVPTKAAFYVFPKIDLSKFNVESDRAFAKGLLENKHILVIPGSGFDFPEPDHFRIVMLPQPDMLAKAVRDMGDYLDSIRK